jgi:hypothetical protein
VQTAEEAAQEAPLGRGVPIAGGAPAAGRSSSTRWPARPPASDPAGGPGETVDWCTSVEVELHQKTARRLRAEVGWYTWRLNRGAFHEVLWYTPGGGPRREHLARAGPVVPRPRALSTGYRS